VATSRSTKQGSRIFVFALAVAGVVILASGCGGAERLSKTAYEQKVQALYADVQARFEATRGASGSTLAARVEAAQTQLRATADELESGEPPRAVEKEHEELVEGMREYVDDLDALLDAVSKGDAAGIERFNVALAENEAIEQMAEAAEEMKFKGFDLGRIAEE
jgi:hypothetical protein